MKRTWFGLIVGIALISLLAPLIASCGKAGSTTSTTAAPTQSATTTLQPSTAAGTSTSAKPTATPARKPEGTLRIVADDIGNERWLPNQAIAYLYLISGVYDFLIGRKIPTGELIPQLAEKWESSTDGKVWTFYLKKGVQFHDSWGELTADDVKYSIELAAGKDSVSSDAASFRKMTVDVVNPYQFTITTAAPMVTVPYLLTNNPPDLPIVSKKYIQSVGVDAGGAHPIGSGPFRFAEQKSGTYVKMEALDSHWRQTAYWKTVYYMVVPEQSTRLAMIKTGELDIAPTALSGKKEAQSMNLKLISQPQASEVYIALGGQYLPTRPTFDATVPWVGDPKDPASVARALKVRQALNLAVNKQEIIDRILQGEGQLLSVLPGMVEFSWNDAGWKPYPYDPTKAKQLLAEAGYPMGFQATMRLVSQPAIVEGPDIGQAVAQYWQKIGIDVKIITMDYALDRQNWVDRKVSGIASTRAVTVKDEPILFTIMASGGTISYLVESPTIDDLLKQASAEPDLQKRAALYKKMGQYYYDGYYSIPIALKNALYAVSGSVGQLANLNGNSFLLNVEYISKASK